MQLPLLSVLVYLATCAWLQDDVTTKMHLWYDAGILLAARDLEEAGPAVSRMYHRDRRAREKSSN